MPNVLAMKKKWNKTYSNVLVWANPQEQSSVIGSGVPQVKGNEKYRKKPSL